MHMPRYQSRYSKQEESSIRFSVLEALQELAKFNGIDINTIKTTNPYSLVLNGVTSQKIAVELRKLIDSGMVVKEVARGKTVKYMLRENYVALQEEGQISKIYGYGDYRDNKVKDKNDEEEINIICTRIETHPNKVAELVW